jgi:hypothetical protein
MRYNVTGLLGYAHTLAGRSREALDLLEEILLARSPALHLWLAATPCTWLKPTWAAGWTTR